MHPPKIEIKKKRAYLVESPPTTPEGQEILMEWVEFLAEEAGKEGAEKIIKGYVSMGWISPLVAEALLSYLDVVKVVEPDLPLPELSPDAHRKSLQFVKKLMEV